MYKNTLTLLRSFLTGGLVFIALTAQASVENITPYAELKSLEATREHSLTTQQVINSLLRGHYENHALNDNLSSMILDQYLKDLDNTRSYFLESDIKEFESFRYQFDSDLNRGKLTNAFLIFNRFQQRLNERLSFVLSELQGPAKEYRYDTDEVLELDREQAPWLKTSAELDELWRKRLKNSILSLRNSGKEDQETFELLQKRYQNQLNRVHQVKAEDAYQAFMNSVTSTFDPHTQYLSPRNTENFNINMSLSLQGIGAVLQADDEYTKVVRLVPAGPADKAGNLQPADRILSVGQSKDNLTDVIGWRLDEVVDLIRGPKGSTVYLEVAPALGSSESKVIAIVRDEVKLEEQSAKKEILEIQEGDTTRKIGVIDIPTFYIDFQGRMENKPDYTSTTRDVLKLIQELKKDNIDGLIIDLRNNGGGSLEEAINLTGLFIGAGPVVQVRNANGQVEVLASQYPFVSYNGPLTVLVNRLSASASEIFAGAIQDYGRGLVLGNQTFGKGTVQSLRPLRSGQLKITQAKFYRISGDSTQSKGIIPDIEFPSLLDSSKIGESALDEALPWDSIKAAPYEMEQHLDKAISALKTQHLERIQTNPDFLFLKKQRQLIDQLQQQTTLSLNEKVRAEEKKANDEQRLNLENKRRQAKGLKLLNTLEELDKDNDLGVGSKTKLAQNNEASKKETSKKATDSTEQDKTQQDKDEKDEIDALLLESAHILLDLNKMDQKLIARGKRLSPPAAPF